MSTVGNEPLINTITEQLRRIVLKKKIDHKAKIYEQSDLKTVCIYCKLNGDIKPQSYGGLFENYIIKKYGNQEQHGGMKQHTAESQLLVHSLLSVPEREVRVMDSRSSVGVYDKSAPHGIKKNSPSACIGDICIAGTQNYEVKVSLGGSEHNKFNFVQIRMNHICDYLLIAYHLSAANIDTNGELFVFKLTKPEIKHLILKYGGLAHGTTSKKGIITQESIDVIGNQTEYALRPKYGDACWAELVNIYRINDYETILKFSVSGTIEGNQVGPTN